MPLVIYDGDERFRLSIADAWIEFRLLTPDEDHQLYAAAFVEGKKGETPSFHNAPAYKKACVLRAATDWGGFVDRRQQPIPFSTEALRKMLERDKVVQILFYERFSNPNHPDVKCLNDAEPPLQMTEEAKKGSSTQPQ